MQWESDMEYSFKTRLALSPKTVKVFSILGQQYGTRGYFVMLVSWAQHSELSPVEGKGRGEANF